MNQHKFSNQYSQGDINSKPSQSVQNIRHGNQDLFGKHMLRGIAFDWQHFPFLMDIPLF